MIRKEIKAVSEVKLLFNFFLKRLSQIKTSLKIRGKKSASKYLCHFKF